MSDFMKWLYPRYIRPYVEAAPQEEYEMWLSLMESDLEYQFREEFDKTLEFTAIHAFLLDQLYREAKVENVEYGETIAVTAVCTPKVLGQMAPFLVE